MRSLKKFYITLASLMAGTIAMCSVPQIAAKYQNIVPEDNAFEIKFPIDNIGKQAADALIESLTGVLNDTDRFDDLIRAMTNRDNPNANLTEDQKYGFIPNDGNTWRYTYVGNVAGDEADKSTQLIKDLFGDSIVFNEQPVTIMIKREDLDGNKGTGEGYSNTNKYTPVGREMTLYTTTAKLGTAAVGNGVAVEVYAMVFAYNNQSNGNRMNNSNTLKGGTWQFVAQYKGTAITNDYNGGTGNNSFNTERWYADKPTTLYTAATGKSITLTNNSGYGYTDRNVITLRTLIQNEKTAQDNLNIILSGGTTKPPSA